MAYSKSEVDRDVSIGADAAAPDAAAPDASDAHGDGAYEADTDQADTYQEEAVQVAPVELTPHQQAALEQLLSFVHSREKLHLLTGYAGTGKTTLMQALIYQLRQAGDRRPVVLTAFSNKATKVLMRMAEIWGLEVDCMTCCKLLALKPEIDSQTGKQVFRPDPNSENRFDRYRLVIVDEASMVDGELWLLLTASVADLYKQTQILFVGDAAQLPPVNERESQVFSQIHERTDLTEVVRYGGPIGVLATQIRQNPRRHPTFVTQANRDRTQGVFALRRPQWKHCLIQALESQAYRQDSDYVRALAYTNARVHQLNRAARGVLYGRDADQFVVGERLIANSPCWAGDALLLQNSEECEVLVAVEGEEGPWRVWFLEVVTDGDKYRSLTVLHNSSRNLFDSLLKKYAAERRWQEFWELKNLFHDLGYAYCLTIHKSQGSTFQNVFVDVPNIGINSNHDERNQLLYVAVTRAAQRVFLLTHGS
ncbi:MAG: AAA family ATPase [Cyanobacteria bacterium P01_A01_bin.135]